MTPLLLLKVCYKSQPAVTTRQGHQKRIMRKTGCKKKHLCSKGIFSSQGKTVLSPQVNARSSIGQTYYMLASSSRVLNVTVHRLIWHNVRKSQSLISRHRCRTAISEVGWFFFFLQSTFFYCAMSGWSSTSVPLVWSKVLILFGPKQHTVISSATDGKRDYSKLDNTFTSRKVLHINSYYILNNTVFLDPCTIFYRQYVFGTLLYDMVKVSWGISQKGYIQLEDLLWAPACWDKDLCRTSQNTSMVSLWHLYGTIIYRGVSTMTHWTYSNQRQRHLSADAAEEMVASW